MALPDIDYSRYPSLITSSDQLATGMVVYHVYGHLDSDPRKRTIVEVDYKDPYLSDQMFPMFSYTSERGILSSTYGDVGLDGVNHNYNRMFGTMDDAYAFIADCKIAGVPDFYRQVVHAVEEY